MRTSEETTLIFGALHEVQQNLPVIKADLKNDYFNSLYADLTAVWNGIRGLLAEKGVVVIQGVAECMDGTASLSTRLCHISGQWIEDDGVPLIVEPNKKGNKTAQQQGSAITYARRQGLSAMLGIVTDEDDDGAQASQTLPSRTEAKAGTAKPKTKKLTGPIKTMTALKEAMGELNDEIDACDTMPKLEALQGVEKTKKLTTQLKADWPEAAAKLETKINETKKKLGDV